MKKTILLFMLLVIQTGLFAQVYYPEGTKWTEIRLDTMKYDSWYSKVGDEWVPNFETIEYYVQGEYVDERFNLNDKYVCVYTSGPDWVDSLTLFIQEPFYDEVYATTPRLIGWYTTFDGFPAPGHAYQFNWHVGDMLYSRDVSESNCTCIHPNDYVYGIIDEIKEGYFGGVRPLKYADLNGKAPVDDVWGAYNHDTNGGRIIQGIGVTEWKNGECLFGPIKPYECSTWLGFDDLILRHYRSMLVHFERNGEVLYNVWPRKGSTVEVAIDGLNYFLFLNTHVAVITTNRTCSGELDIPSEVTYEGETFVVKSMTWNAFYNNPELTKVRIPKSIESIMHSYPVDPDWLDPPAGMVSSDYMNPFIGCTALESIEVDADNPIMSSDGGVLFNKDKTRLYGYPAGACQKTYIVPETVIRVGSGAFRHSQYLTTLIIPNNVTHIGGSLCSNSVNLKMVRLSENINLIEAYSFEWCEKLRLLDIPESVQSFGEYVFRKTPFEKIVFRGTFPNGLRTDTFYSMDASTVIYAQPSEVAKFKKVFSGTVLPLEKYKEDVYFIQDQMATIILPTAPDASKGKYYKLDRCEDGQIVFTQETQPLARTPYIIVPNEDFSIDMSTLDVAGLSPDTVTVGSISFIGSYVRTELPALTGGDGGGSSSSYYDIIDQTPDCQGAASSTEMSIVGALRAYLVVKWDDPIDYGGTRSPQEKMEIVLHDEGSYIRAIDNGKWIMDNSVYDLSGRRVGNGKWKMDDGKLKPGLYIVNGKKVQKPGF